MSARPEAPQPPPAPAGVRALERRGVALLLVVVLLWVLWRWLRLLVFSPS